MGAAIHYEPEAFTVSHGRPMGRHFAGFGFLSAFARHSSDEHITGLVRNAKIGSEFTSSVKEFNPQATPRYILQSQASQLAELGCFFTPSPVNKQQIWMRELHGAGSWSVCGINHTLSSDRTMDAVTEWLTLPVQPWDAVICTSRVSRDVISKLIERQAEFLSRRLGATRFVLPNLPLIPLGVDCDAQTELGSHRHSARTSLGLDSNEVVVLFLGRLSFHAKANPAPMYLALERLAKRHRLVLIECGWAASEPITQAFEAARAKLCPSVRSIVLDGRESEERAKAWAAGDIFCSLSDNIQETFGLTPIEAMARGLPVVVTDWDGYKDTVRDGIDGFMIPTMAAPSGAGLDLAVRYAYDLDSYDLYIAQASTSVVVDVEATAEALDRLASDPELRQRLGANGAARAREIFDWKVVIRAYERLWDDLGRLRRESNAPSSPAPGHAALYRPARPDPFELCASFPSSHLSLQHRAKQMPGVDLEEGKTRLQLKVALLSSSASISERFLVELWLELGNEWRDVGRIVEGRSRFKAQHTIRALLWLAKFGLACIRKPKNKIR
jgi:glycosyltransferase involved in cell wall biosynthesis